MKFSGVRSFAGMTIEQVLKYLSVDLSRTLKDLETGLTRVTFAENFQSQRASVSLASGAVAQIPNRLGAIDLEWIIVDIRGESSLVRDPDAPWTKDFVYLKNVGAGDITATVRFFRG